MLCIYSQYTLMLNNFSAGINTGGETGNPVNNQFYSLLLLSKCSIYKH